MNITLEPVFVERPESSNPAWAVNSIENSVTIRVIYGIITLVGLIGNFLVCFTLIRVSALRSKTSHFIIHLAVSDILTLLWIIPLHLFPYVPRLPQQPGYDALCRLFFSKFPLWTTIFSSAYSLLLITTERFMAIVFPVRYKTIFTKRNSGLMMAACWVIGIISNVYFLVIFSLREGSCSLKWPNRQYQLFVAVYNIIIVYLFPICFMLDAHYKMITELKERVNQMTNTRRKSGVTVRISKADSKKAWQLRTAEQLVRTLLWVVITYAICWAPNQIIYFAYNMGAPVDFSRVYYHFSVILAICTSCLNPVIYSLKNKPFRRGLKESLHWNKSLPKAPSSRSYGVSRSDALGATSHVHRDESLTLPSSTIALQSLDYSQTRPGLHLKQKSKHPGTTFFCC